MRRTLYTLAALAFAAGCNDIDIIELPAPDKTDAEDGCYVPVVFGVSGRDPETRSGAEAETYEDSLFRITYEDLEPVASGDEEATRAVSVTTQSNLTSFYLNTTAGTSESVVSTNVVFTGKSGGNYSATGGMYWPSDDPSYHFYASNIQLQTTGSTYHLLTCPADQDVVYAYNASPAHRQVNSLAFNHVYGRIGTVSISVPDGYTATLTSAAITASKSGTFNVKTGSWASASTAQSISLSSSNDVWIVPGTYEMSATFTLSDGKTTQKGITRSGSVTISANKVNNIAVKVNDSYEYELTVTPSPATIYVGTTESFTATYATKFGGSVIASENVTSSATWSSSKTSVATVSSGTVTGVALGTATVTASYLSATATASVTIKQTGKLVIEFGN